MHGCKLDIRQLIQSHRVTTNVVAILAQAVSQRPAQLWTLVAWSTSHLTCDTKQVPVSPGTFVATPFREDTQASCTGQPSSKVFNFFMCICSTSLPGGNQVDGLPPASSGMVQLQWNFFLKTVIFDLTHVRPSRSYTFALGSLYRKFRLCIKNNLVKE